MKTSCGTWMVGLDCRIQNKFLTQLDVYICLYVYMYIYIFKHHILMSISSISFHIYTVSAIRRSETLEGRGNEAPLAVSSCPSLPKPWELIGMGKFGCSHHHHHHQHYHRLSSHSPTLFGVSCRNIFLKVFLTKFHYKKSLLSLVVLRDLSSESRSCWSNTYLVLLYMLYVICYM